MPSSNSSRASFLFSARATLAPGNVLGYTAPIVVTVRYTNPPPEVGGLARGAGRFMYPGRGKIKDPTGGALHYFAHRKARPNWAKRGWGFILGDHTFVRLMGR